MSRNLWNSPPPVQWREEESRINHGEDSPQRFQPTWIPRDSNRYKPQHRGAAWFHHHHPGVTNPAALQAAPNCGP
jgi:hypothetical protein